MERNKQTGEQELAAAYTANGGQPRAEAAQSFGPITIAKDYAKV